MSRAPVILVVLLAGCLDPTDPVTEQQSLADVSTCDFRYPDNRSVDCTGDGAIIATSAPPEGWICIDQGGQGEVRVFGDENGNVGFAYRTADVPGGSGKAFGAAGIVGSSSNRVVFEGGLSGFVRLPQPAPSTNERVDFSMIRAAANGTPDVFSSQNLDARVSLYESDAWVVWAFPGEQDTYFFTTMAGFAHSDGVSYQPVGLQQNGTDFQVGLTTQTRRFEGDYTRPNIAQTQTGVGSSCDPLPVP